MTGLPPFRLFDLGTHPPKVGDLISLMGYSAYNPLLVLASYRTWEGNPCRVEAFSLRGQDVTTFNLPEVQLWELVATVEDNTGP